jgi:hypothetical protein
MSLALPFTANLFSLGIQANLIEICGRVSFRNDKNLKKKEKWRR